MKPKKCQLLRNSVVFLGRLVSREGVQVPPGRLLEIVIGVYHCASEMFSLLLWSYWDHIPKFALVAKPLYDIMGLSSTFRWGTEQEMAFDELRQKLMEAPVHAHPNSEDLFILDTDASNYAIGADLVQVQNGVERLIGFGSFVLDFAKRHYCTTRKELLAVLRFTRHFKHYLLGRRFTLRTDHNSLLWLMGFTNIEGLGGLRNWQYIIMDIVHRPGKDHVNADGLSGITDPLVQCNYYSYGCDVQDLPCGGCKYYVRANEQWDRFHDEVDDVISLLTGIFYMTGVILNYMKMSPWWESISHRI